MENTPASTPEGLYPPNVMLPYCGGGSLAGVSLAPPPCPIALKLPRTGGDVEVGEAVDEVTTSEMTEDVMENVAASVEVDTDSVAKRLVAWEPEFETADEGMSSVEVSGICDEVDEPVVTILPMLES